MNGHVTGEPLGERVRALEVAQENLGRKLDLAIASIDGVAKGQQEILLALERRTVAIRIASGVVHFFELIVAAVAGAEAPRLIRLAGG